MVHERADRNMRTVDYPYYLSPFLEFNPVQSAVVPFLDKDVNIVASFQTATGKCLRGDMRVSLSDGSIESLCSLFTWGQEHDVLSLNQTTLRFEAARSTIHKLKHGRELVEIVSGRGNFVCTTPEHPFLIKRSEYLEWIPALELKEGDYIVVPSRIPTPMSQVMVNVDGAMSSIKHGFVSCSSLFSRLAMAMNHGNVYGHQVNAARLLGVKKCNIRNWEHGVAIPIDLLMRACDIAGVGINSTGRLRLRGSNSKKTFVIPTHVSKSLSRFLGMIIADGHIDKNRVEFFNYDSHMRATFSSICNQIFGIKAQEKRDERLSRVVGSVVYSQPFSELIVWFGIPRYAKSDKVTVPSIISCQPDGVIGAFLSGAFDCDGSVHKNIEYYSDSEALVFGIQSLLLRFRIRSAIVGRIKKGKARWRLSISGQENLILFQQHVGFALRRKAKRLKHLLSCKPNTNVDIVPHSINSLRKIKDDLGLTCADMGSSICSVLYSGRNLSFMAAREFLSRISSAGSDSLSRLSTIVGSDIRFEKVVSKRTTEPEEYVYDLVVPVHHNFISENIVVHNTLLAECAFAFHLSTTQETRVAYVCPFRSLGEEKFREWKANSQLAKFFVTISTGDHVVSKDEFLAGRLAIVTAESFDSKMRSPGYADWAKSMVCVAFDEAHIMGDRNGAIETALMRLTKLNPKSRLLLLSATLGNAKELARWLKLLNGKPTKCFTSDWRPVKVEVETHVVDDGYQPKIDKAVELAAGSEGKTIVFVHSKVVGAEICKKLKAVRVRCGFHNASVPYGRRSRMEAAFASQYSGLDVLVSTSTLASGVNLA